MTCLLVALATAGLCAGAAAAQTWTDFLVYDAQGPVANPYKGFMDYSPGAIPGSADFPHSLEFFTIGMDEFYVQGPPGVWNVDFTALEVELDDIASRGRQAVFRVFVDTPRQRLTPCPTPGNEPIPTTADTALPPFLFDGIGSEVALHYYCDEGADLEGFSPDYLDSDFKNEVTNLIDELDVHYDGDERIAFIEAGFLGHWGEWHTFFDPADPLACYAGAPSASAVHSLMNAVLGQFDELDSSGGFDITRVVVSADVLQCQLDFTGGSSAPGVYFFRAIGIHDDDFANTTVCDATYGYASRSASFGLDGDWKSLSIGGEVQPDLQHNIHDPGDATVCEAIITNRDTDELDTAIDTVHASWLLDYDLFHRTPPVVDPQLANAEASARRMGYEFFVSQVALPDLSVPGQVLEVTVRIENRGTAPIAYDLDVELVILDVSNNERASVLSDIFLSDVFDDPDVPGVEPEDFEITVADLGLGDGTYRAALRVANPMAGGVSLEFANLEQNGDLLILGDFQVTGSTIFVDGFESGNLSAWN